MSEPAERKPGAGWLLTGCAVTFVLVLGLAALGDQPPAPPAPVAAPPPLDSPAATTPTAQVSGGGLTLTSTSVTFPDDDVQYAQGPGADVMNQNCTACHSANMVLAQPALSATQWKSEVEKMRNTYKAPVQEKDVPAIVAYLTALSGKIAPAGAPSATTKGAPSGSASSVSG